MKRHYDRHITDLTDTYENQVTHLRDKNEELQDENSELRDELDKLIHQLKEHQRARFGWTSERVVDEDQLTLFEGDNDVAEASRDGEPIEETITYTRSKGKQTRTLKEPDREIIITVPDTERACECGNDKEVIRYQTSYRIMTHPARYEVVAEKREVMACRKGCDGSVVTAPKVPHLLGSLADETLHADVITSKVLDRQPMYHLSKKLERRYGLVIQRDTLARWMIQVAERCQVLVNRFVDTVIDYDVASLDATRLQILNTPTRAPTSKSYA